MSGLERPHILRELDVRESVLENPPSRRFYFAHELSLITCLAKAALNAADARKKADHLQSVARALSVGHGHKLHEHTFARAVRICSVVTIGAGGRHSGASLGEDVKGMAELEFLLIRTLFLPNPMHDWIERLQTPGYWAIRDMDVTSGRPSPLIESECQRLTRWLEEFDRELVRINEEDGQDRESARLVLDTSAIVRHRSFTDIDWPPYANAKSVRLFIPILVVRELDDLKDSGRSDKARSRLRNIRTAIAERGRGPAPIAACNTTVELLMDPPNHNRLPIADEEIIRRAQYLRGRPGGPVRLATGDYTMQFMAEADDLPVLFLPDELRLGVASNSQEAGQSG